MIRIDSEKSALGYPVALPQQALDTADYVAAFSHRLAQMARQENLLYLSHLLDMAGLEATRLLQAISVSKNHMKN